MFLLHGKARVSCTIMYYLILKLFLSFFFFCWFSVWWIKWLSHGWQKAVLNRSATFFIFVLWIVTLKINKASEPFQTRCFKTKTDIVKRVWDFIFNCFPVALLNQGSFFKFCSHRWGWGYSARKLGWFYVGLLTTVKEGATNMCSFLDRQNHITDIGQSE